MVNDMIIFSFLNFIAQVVDAIHAAYQHDWYQFSASFPAGLKFHLFACIFRQIQLTDYSIYIDGLVQERCKSSVLAMELRLLCIKPSIYAVAQQKYTQSRW